MGGSALRSVDQPLAWVGGDRLLLDDVNEYGLHRLVYARKGEPPDAVSLLSVTQRRANGRTVRGWAVEIGEFWFLWLVWKEPEKARKMTDWTWMEGERLCTG